MYRTLVTRNRRIGPGEPVYVVAEMSANHNGRLEQAAALIEAAARAGADAIKLQTYTADTMTIDCARQEFHITGTPWKGRRLYELYVEAHTPWEWHPKLQSVAADLGLDFFSTPFDGAAVDFLEELDVDLYKIASFEIVDLPLLRRIASTGKGVIMSTGMSSLGEIEEAVQTIAGHGGGPLALLKCTSAYPAPPASMHLRTIPHLAQTFKLPVGLSDHTLGIAAAVSAVALGASIIEKHFTLSRADGGPDAAFSLEPDEFRAMVDGVRTAEQALGDVHYGVTEQEAGSTVFRRSLFVTEHVQAGEVFNDQNVRCIRPGCGLHPRHLTDVLGRRASRDVERGTPMTWDLLARAAPVV